MLEKVFVDDLKLLESKDPKVKYSFAKALLETAKSNPENLYHITEHFSILLHSKNNILKWNAIDIIANLSSIDFENKIDSQIPYIIDLLHTGQLITVNHAILGLGQIAANKPEIEELIYNELILVKDDKFETEECRAIAMGKVIQTVEQFFNGFYRDNKFREFLTNCLSSERSATRKKAENFIRNYLS